MSDFMKTNKDKKENGPIGARQSFHSMERLLRAGLESQFKVQSPSAIAVELPDVELPNLDQIRLTVYTPDHVDKTEVLAELKDRLAETAIQQAERIQRKPGEPLKAGDRIQADIVSYVGGRIAPFACHENLTLYVEPGTLVPGFAESMIGVPVGACVIVISRFPEDYPNPALCGKNISISVFVRSAEELQFAATKNVRDEIVETMVSDILREKGMQYRLEGIHLALGMLAESAAGAVTDKMLDCAMQAEWSGKLEKFLASRHVPLSDLADAKKQWLGDFALRENMRHRLAVTLAVRAVAKRNGLSQPDREEFQEYLRNISETAGFSFEELKESLSKEPQTEKALYEQCVIARTVDFITSNIHLEFHSN